MKKNTEDLWTLHETATYLQVNEEVLRRWCRQKKIPHLKIGGWKYRFLKQDVINYFSIPTRDSENDSEKEKGEATPDATHTRIHHRLGRSTRRKQ